MKVFVPVADNGSGLIYADYMVALVSALSESGLEIQMSRAADSLATRAMNRISADFLYGDCDEMLIIDCDIEVRGEDLKRLFSHDVLLVYGPYMKRQPKQEFCFATLNNGDTPPTDGSLWSVRREGRGYTRVSRKLLEMMKEENGGPARRFHNHGRFEWEFWPSGVIEGEDSTAGQGRDADGYPIREFISEDWQFCDRARALGVPVYVDMGILGVHNGACKFPLRYTPDMLPEILESYGPEQIVAAWREWIKD